jgi:N-acetylmuramoyl-L-alanine amidase
MQIQIVLINMIHFLLVLLSFICFFSCFCISQETILPIYKDLNLETTSWEKVFEENHFSLPSRKTRKQEIQSIVLHSTEDLSTIEFIRKSLINEFFFQLLIQKDGKVLGDTNPTAYVYFLTPALDETTIHIVLEGKEIDSLKNTKQLETLENIIRIISSKANVPLQNKNIVDKRGIFTHTQVKKKYGFFTELTDCGSELVVKNILTNLKGQYYPELEWQGRFESDWIVRKEKIDPNQKPKDFDRGRGISIQPTIDLKSLEKDKNGKTPESFRLKYVFKGTIKPSCIVLHYTAIPSFQRSQEVLEMRKLSATIMVDKDAKAYQLLDNLTDLAQAASGTNQNCIQIEIVGKNTEELMQNELQAEKVTALVLELSEKFDIKISNEKIESLKGVFSHTQAKKKFGGSAALMGKEFDPGEIYMEKIILKAKGEFFPEEKWYDRRSNNWVMIFKDFQP